MIPRLNKILKSNSFFLFGARGTGKSTFIKKQFLDQIPENEIIIIDLLLPEIEDLYAKNPERLKSEILAHKEIHSLQWVFIDEVQKIPRLLDIVHHLIEEENIKFILTGSSSRKLKRGSANLLAGRAFVYPLYPFTSFELSNSFDLDHALHWGTLPKIFNLDNSDEKMAFLRAYALTYLKEEIQVEQLIRKLDPFRAFLEIAAQCNGEIINYSSISRNIGSVDHKTIQSYFQILEDTHLGFLLPNFHRSFRKSQSSHPKFYFFDTGVKRALEQTLDVKLKPQTSAYGDAFEHWVISEIHRLNEILTKDFKLSYYRDKNSEIDLILSKPNTTILIEIKSSKTIDPIKIKRFAKLSESFPNSQNYWLSLDKSTQKIENVLCLHWQVGLEKIFETLPIDKEIS